MEEFTYEITIKGRPPAKSNCYKVRAFIQNGKARGLIYTTREMEEFETNVGELISEVIPKILDMPLQMEVHFYQYGKKDVDIDNILKAISDSGDYKKSVKDKFRDELSGGWLNDKLFWKFIVERKIAKTKEDERVEIVVTSYEGETYYE